MTPNHFQVTRSKVKVTVTLNSKWFWDDNSTMLTPRIMKLHRYIDDDWQMTPVNFQVTSNIPALCSPKIQVVSISKIYLHRNNSRITLLTSFPIPYNHTSRTTFNEVTLKKENYKSIHSSLIMNA